MNCFRFLNLLFFVTDFAVGAPYESNPKNLSTGAVYIFRGAKNPSDIKVSQILYAEDFISNTDDKIQRFGESLSGGSDMDSNNYPDLVIGAFPSNIVFVVRTYPIVNIIATIENLNSLQDIDQTACSKQLLDQKPCFTLNLCFEILENKRNKNIINTKLPILNFTLTGDTKQSFSRIKFVKTNTEKYENKIDVDGNNNKCELIDVGLNSNFGDYLTPLTISVNFNFDFDRQNIENRKNLQDINKYPFINQDFSKKDFEVWLLNKIFYWI